MNPIIPTTWSRIRVHYKVVAVLSLLLVPFLSALIYLVSQVSALMAIQEHRHQVMLIRQEIRELRRLAIDIEDAFRGFILTRQERFLLPMKEAEARLPEVMKETTRLASNRGTLSAELKQIEKRLADLMESKNALLDIIRRDGTQKVESYVREGKGLELSDAVRLDLREAEDQLDQDIHGANASAEDLSRHAWWGILAAVTGTLGLGWVGASILSASITRPLVELEAAARAFGTSRSSGRRGSTTNAPERGTDEIGRLTHAFTEMNEHIDHYIRELETLHSIGQEITMITPNGAGGVLTRIADRAVELIYASSCLVLLRDEQMGCWIVEAASGGWSHMSRKTVLLWEEFDVAAKAFESGTSQAGSGAGTEVRPELGPGDSHAHSMLAVPLLREGHSMGVLLLRSESILEADDWNTSLAAGLAQVAAIAISNANLYEASQEHGLGLRIRLRQLEHLAEMLAHDLKGPGQRMSQLAAMLKQQCTATVDPRARKWLEMLEQNGDDLTSRVEGILAVARVGADQASVRAVDSNLVLAEVLKSRAGELEAAGALVEQEPLLPVLACHRAYLRQVFDNLLSNALRYARPGVPLRISIKAEREGAMTRWTFSDNGKGIPVEFRERVFLPFVRLDPHETSGIGIGLSIVQRIIELYKGRIWIAGDSASGATFHFTLPALNEWQGGQAPPVVASRSIS